MKDGPLRTGVVHVWTARLDAAATDGLHALLAPDEQRRGDEFRLERDRRRFLVARLALRLLLAGYLDCNAGEIEFTYGPYGKPGLQSGGLEFNLTHTGDLAKMTFSADAAVGIDV